MDKSWIHDPTRVSAQYLKGLEEFIQLARGHTDSLNRARCPCRECKNLTFMQMTEVEDHLYKNGMYIHYTHWVWHGEGIQQTNNDHVDHCGDDSITNNEDDDIDEVYEFVEDIYIGKTMQMDLPDIQQGKESSSHASTFPKGEAKEDSFERLFRDAQRELYPGCSKFSKLSFILKLFHLKVSNRWSNKSFNMLLEVLRDAQPEGETLPKSHYEAKRKLRDLGLGYIPIHSCKNDCALFWKEHEHKEACPECGESRYKFQNGKGKKIPQKILRYFPLKPRLQKLFMSRNTARDMRWHKEKRVKEENVLSHPADSKTWEEFDKEHGWFANDSRNVRLGLSSDGFNPFGNMSNAYSMWPVFVVPYNLPSWKCLKEPYIFMSLLIPGPKSPGKDIDVYLRPLIDDLKDLWMNGVMTYDAFTRRNFKLHAAVLWTISDFPAYSDLSGWCTKGYLACPSCNKNTCSMYLEYGQKICYTGHRCFLPEDHAWRKRQKQFDGKKENRPPPKELNGDEVMEQLQYVKDTKFGKKLGSNKRKRPKIELNWTKKSIFFELPYWQGLKLRHNLDIMHIEKNICDNVLGTLMNIEGKTKDTIKTRMDLQAMGIRKELHLIRNGDKFVMPKARYTLSQDEKKSLCDWLKSLKLPDGYASNTSRYVNADTCKITGMKSHDSHVLLQCLLPIAIRGYLDADVRNALIELGLFFKELCCKTLKLKNLEALQRDIVVILCKLEMIFPPAFFDVMVHLAVHLPREAILAEPAQYRWMYPFERFLHKLKSFVRNKARPEGSIAEAYIDNECLTFCSMHLRGVETRFNREERNNDGGQIHQQTGFFVFKNIVRPLGASNYGIMDLVDLERAQLYVLKNCIEIESYLSKYIQELEKENPSHVQLRQGEQFPKWFEEHIKPLRYTEPHAVSDDLYSLACGPEPRVKRYTGCIVNGIRFHTRERERNRKTQNNGVVVKGEGIEYYGVLTDIIELRYSLGRQIFIFKCDWWDVDNKKKGIKKDKYFISVNVSCTSYKDDPFVLASQVQQVFYAKDTKLCDNWEVVQKFGPRNMFYIPETEMEKEDEDEDGDGNEVQNENDAYQEYELCNVDGVIQDDTDIDPFPLNREDVAIDEIVVDVVHDIMNSNNGGVNEEEDTDADEYDDEEEELSSSDDDTDVDEYEII